MSTYHKGEKITDYYKLEEEIGRYPNELVLLFLIEVPLPL